MVFRKCLLISAFLSIFILPFLANAPAATAITADEIRAQINALLAQIQQLQEQLAQIQGATSTWCHTFNVNLKVGDSGDEVVALQTALAKDGANNWEYKGYDGVFDEMTASVVTGFQQKYESEILTPLGLKYGTGYVGPATRAKLNKLYGCGLRACTAPVCQTGYVLYDTGEKDSAGCTIYKCIPSTSNKPPVISGVSGPTALQINQAGTWTVTASDPENGVLRYSVVWGDEVSTGISAQEFAPSTYVQTATFTHSYASPCIASIMNPSTGVCNPSFTVTDDHGLSAKTSISVNIGMSVPSITVLSPNGGEVWEIGKTYTIQWAPGNIDVVSVQLLKSGNSVYRWDPPYSFSSINWQIQSSSVFGTLIPGSDYKIRVNYSTTGAGVAFDESDSPFSIVAAGTPSITVLSPNGGERLIKGSTYTIKWSVSNNTWININLLKGSSKYIGIAGPADQPLPQGYYNWTIPTFLPDGDDYTIRISDNTGVVFDDSDAAFSIVATGTTCTDTDGGKNYSIKGTVTDNGKTYTDYCQGAFYLKEYFCLPSSPTGLGGVAEENVVCPNSGSCVNGACVSTTPSITVVSPNGGETWQIGSTYQIKWTPNNIGKNIAINLINYTPGSYYGQQYGIRDGSTVYDNADSGQFSWTIPSSIPAGSYKIYVGDATPNISSSGLTDGSDATFSIVAAGLGLDIIQEQVASVAAAVSKLIEQVRGLMGR
jgi:hypothetical protein